MGKCTTTLHDLTMGCWMANLNGVPRLVSLRTANACLPQYSDSTGQCLCVY